MSRAVSMMESMVAVSQCWSKGSNVVSVCLGVCD